MGGDFMQSSVVYKAYAGLFKHASWRLMQERAKAVYRTETVVCALGPPFLKMLRKTDSCVSACRRLLAHVTRRNRTRGSRCWYNSDIESTSMFANKDTARTKYCDRRWYSVANTNTKRYDIVLRCQLREELRDGNYGDDG